MAGERRFTLLSPGILFGRDSSVVVGVSPSNQDRLFAMYLALMPDVKVKGRCEVNWLLDEPRKQNLELE